PERTPPRFDAACGPAGLARFGKVNGPRRPRRWTMRDGRRECAAMSAPAPSPSTASADAPSLALRCSGLVKHYGDVKAVDGIDLEVSRGICFGLLGPNGAGKTTTLEMIEGLTPPTAGRIE